MEYSYSDDVNALRACIAASTHPESKRYFAQRYLALYAEIYNAADAYARDHAKLHFNLLLALGNSEMTASERSLALYNHKRDEFLRASF